MSAALSVARASQARNPNPNPNPSHNHSHNPDPNPKPNQAGTHRRLRQEGSCSTRTPASRVESIGATRSLEP